MRRIAPLFLIVVAGCGSDRSALMPLQVGKEWTYHVESGLLMRVESVKVVRSLPIGDVDGFEMSGPLGVSTLAWRGNALLQQSAANIRYSPPLPLLPTNGKSTVWNGFVSWLSRGERASAQVTERPSLLPLGAHQYETRESIVVLRLESHVIQLNTWFEPGYGIVKQEQRTNDQLDYSLEKIAGN